MKLENLPKSKHKVAIKLFRAQKINKLKVLFNEYKVSSCSSFCDKKYINEWMTWAITSGTLKDE